MNRKKRIRWLYEVAMHIDCPPAAMRAAACLAENYDELLMSSTTSVAKAIGNANASRGIKWLLKHGFIVQEPSFHAYLRTFDLVIPARDNKNIPVECLRIIFKDKLLSGEAIQKLNPMVRRTYLDWRRKTYEGKKRFLYEKVLLRDKSLACRYCGTEENIVIDHIQPILHGGTDELDNLQFLCQSCNSSKGTTYAKG